MKIVKRNGDVVDFDKNKIYQAIKKANEEDPNNLLSHRSLCNLTDEVVYIAESISNKTGNPPTVEGVQDIVEKTLIKNGLADIAKRYIIYRQTHARIREAKDFLMETFQELNCKDASDIDIKRENANIDADTAMGMMLKYGSTAANFFVDNYILPKEMADAHRDGDFHIHDKDFYLLTETCCQIDLLKLFKDGFHTGHGTLREPNSIGTAAALACIAIQSNQNSMHGGQAVPHFDYCMAPYVEKTFEKEYEDALDIYDDCDYISARTFARDRAMYRTERATYQAMEALIHNLNTMHCLPSYEKLWVYDTKEKVLDLLCIEELYECFEENRYQVISLNRNTMQTELKRISHVTRKDKNRRLIEIKTNYGQKACTTDNHLWLTNEDGIVVDKSPEDISSVIMPRKITMPESIPYIKLQSLAKIRSDTPFNENKLEVTELLAELIGYYVADGSVIGGSSLSFATYHKVDYDRLIYLVRKCFGNDVSYQGYPRMIAGVKMQEHRFSVGTYLARNIKSICGDGAEQKRVPNEILISSDAKIRLAFLNAYFSCDAKVGGYIESTSVSCLLIKQIQFMLLSFGVVPKFSICKNGHQYRLVIPGFAASKIGLKLKKTPKFELQREDLDYAQKRLRSKYQLTWFKDLTHRHTKNGKNQIRYDEAIKACKKHGIDYNADEILKTINVMTIPTEAPSISYSGECFVYDLGVEDNENFMTEDGLFVHNSRAGAQTPFSSLNYGTDTSWQGRLVIKCLLDATQAGLGNGETPIFPVQIFKVKEGINYNKDDPNYDLFKLAMETSAKRLFPNFSFLDAPFNKEFYTKPGDWNHEVAYMG